MYIYDGFRGRSRIPLTVRSNYLGISRLEKTVKLLVKTCCDMGSTFQSNTSH